MDQPGPGSTPLSNRLFWFGGGGGAGPKGGKLAKVPLVVVLRWTLCWCCEKVASYGGPPFVPTGSVEHGLWSRWCKRRWMVEVVAAMDLQCNLQYSGGNGGSGIVLIAYPT